MKKTLKLTVHKETLRLLNSTEAGQAAAGTARDGGGGGTILSRCETHCVSCHPECTIA
jgi:hypothetical protein